MASDYGRGRSGARKIHLADADLKHFGACGVSSAQVVGRQHAHILVSCEKCKKILERERWSDAR
jgi:hypothetical protein